MTASASLASLCRANLGILKQKLGLFDLLVTRHGEKGAQNMYTATCAIVGATIGQHVRHTMDHMELAVLVAQDYQPDAELHYDLRVRGGTLERDIEASKQRILDTSNILQQLSLSQEHETYLWKPIKASFMLSGDGQEFELQTTVGRELAFAAHHAIHHMALIKIIALGHANLDPEDLPPDFGRAPATIHHDITEQEKTS